MLFQYDILMQSIDKLLLAALIQDSAVKRYLCITLLNLKLLSILPRYQQSAFTLLPLLSDN